MAGGGADGEPHGRRRRPRGAVLDAGCGDRVSWESGSVALQSVEDKTPSLCDPATVWTARQRERGCCSLEDP